MDLEIAALAVVQPNHYLRRRRVKGHCSRNQPKKAHQYRSTCPPRAHSIQAQSPPRPPDHLLHSRLLRISRSSRWPSLYYCLLQG